MTVDDGTFSFVLTKAAQSERRKMDNTAECSRVSGFSQVLMVLWHRLELVTECSL